MKQLLQTLLGCLGYRIVRRHNDPNATALDRFFYLLKMRGFKPKHILDVGANHGNWTRVALKYFPDIHYTLVEPQDDLKIYVQDLLANNPKIFAGSGLAQRINPAPCLSPLRSMT